MREPRPRIDVCLTPQNREQLETILNSKTSTRFEKLKAEVILLLDVGDQGPKLSNKEVIVKLNLSPRSVGRIKEAYAKNSAIDDLFKFPGLSDQTIASPARDPSSTFEKQVRRRYVEAEDNTNEDYLDLRVKCKVTLTEEERSYLETFVKGGGKQSIRKFNRAKIFLLADQGIYGPAMTDEEIVKKLDVSQSTVVRVRRLFLTKKDIKEALNFNHYKAGRPPKINGEAEAVLVAQACSAPPEGRCKWTVRLLADRLVELNLIESISHQSVAKALKKMNLNHGRERSG